jgi:hypothetical protein
MSEWWTYTLSDIQSFSLHSYYRLFELYNRAIWPAQIAALLLGFAVWFLIWRGRGRLAATILAACWLWVAIVFHAHRYATLTWTARYFAWGFGLEAALLFGRRLAFENRRAGRAIFAFALLVQPLAGFAFGRTWPQLEIFGVAPDPTALATLGVLLLASGRVRWELLVVPLLWCGISGATLLSMEAPEGWIPIAGAVLAFSVAMRETLANRRRRTAVPAIS